MQQKILVAGDWHGNERWARHVISSAGEQGYEIILHVGDLNIFYPDDSMVWEGSFAWHLSDALTQAGMGMIFIDGNHDNHDELDTIHPREDGFKEIDSRLLYAPRGHRWMMRGRRFGALGGAFSINRSTMTLGWDWWATEETTEQNVAVLGNEPLSVLLTHEVPAGIDVQTSFQLPDALEAQAKANRILVADAVRNTNPRLVFSGHWHQRITQHMPFSTTVVNVLDCEYREGNVVSLDLETLEVSEFVPGPMPAYRSVAG